MKKNAKASFLDMITSGIDGSMSATGTVGVLLCVLSAVTFVSLFIFYLINTSEAENILSFIDKCIAMAGIGAGLLGCRKISGAIASKNIQEVEEDAV